MAKANFRLRGKEVTVLFVVCDGDNKTCSYCLRDEIPRGRPAEQIINVEEVHANGLKFEKGSTLFKQAEKAIKTLMLEGRSIHLGEPCEQEWESEIREKAGDELEFELE